MTDGYAGNEHSFEIFPLYKDAVTLAAASGITYTPTLMITYSDGQRAKDLFITRESPHDDPKLRRFYDHRLLLQAILVLFSLLFHVLRLCQVLCCLVCRRWNHRQTCWLLGGCR